MKKLAFMTPAIMLIGLLPFTACQTNEGETHTPLPIVGLSPMTGEEAPDDIIPTPGGYAYRANVHQQGVENPWPPIDSTDVVLSSSSDTLNISYRDYIETLAGEARNNIIHVGKDGGLFNSQLTLYSVAVPAGIGLTDGGRGVGLPGTTGAVLVIEVDPDVAPGQYAFEIGIEIDGKDYGTIPCTIEVVEPDINKSTDNSVYHSEGGYFEISLPPRWVAVEGPENLVPPARYEGLVTFNSWGQNDFWARAVSMGSSDTYTGSIVYSPSVVAAQIPNGGAYVALVRIYSPPYLDSPTEYKLNDLSGLYQPHDCRQDAQSGAQFIEFFMWGRDLQLVVGCHPNASDETVAELNDLLQSWKFDSVPAGDIEWAGLQARQLLPEEVEPLKFNNRPGSLSSEGIKRITEVEVQDETMHFRFEYCWDDLSHWWEIDILPSGEAVLTDEGGDPLSSSMSHLNATKLHTHNWA